MMARRLEYFHPPRLWVEEEQEQEDDNARNLDIDGIFFLLKR
jgi:hypothetical protein